MLTGCVIYHSRSLFVAGLFSQRFKHNGKGIISNVSTVYFHLVVPLSLILLLTLRGTQHRVCSSISQSEMYRDLDDASLDSQDRSKSPCSKSFHQQVYELRNAFTLNDRPTPYRICQIAAETGLQGFEVSMWFQTEQDFHKKWRKSGPKWSVTYCKPVSWT